MSYDVLLDLPPRVLAHLAASHVNDMCEMTPYGRSTASRNAFRAALDTTRMAMTMDEFVLYIQVLEMTFSIGMMARKVRSWK